MIALLSGEVVNKLARFLAAVVLARSLSLSEFGVVNVAIAVAGLALMATNLGLPDIGARDVAVSRSAAAATAGRVVTGRVLTLGVFSVGVGGITLLVGAASLDIVVVTAAMALGLAFSADWLLRGLERMRAVAAASATGGLVVLAGSLTLVQATPSPMVALAVFAAAEFTVSGLTWRAARVRRLVRPGRTDLVLAVRRSWPVGLATFVVYSYYANLDTLILSIARSTAEAGLYSAPYRTFLALNVVGTFAAYSYLPLLAQGVSVGGEEERNAMRRVRRGLPVLGAYGLVVLGMAEAGGGALLGALFGAPFEDVEGAFILLCVAIPWYSVAFPVGYCLIARDANRRFLRGAAVAGTLNLALNLALIPPFGIDGAAIATAVALIAGSIFWLHEHHELREPGLGRLLGLVLAGSAAAVVAAAVPDSSVAIGSATAAAGLAALVVTILPIRG